MAASNQSDATPAMPNLADMYFNRALEINRMLERGLEKAQIYYYRLQSSVIEQYGRRINEFLQMEGSLANLRLPGFNSNEIQTLEQILNTI